jgi:hypothetical protein
MDLNTNMVNSTLKLTQINQFASDLVHANNQGVSGNATAGVVSSIDLKLTDDHFVTGGVLRTLNSAFGDSVTFQVVDVDNVIGYGAGTVLGQYATSVYMRSDSQEQINENIPYPAKIPAGLYLRIVYTSVGTTDVTVTMMYRLHKILI